MFDSEHDRLTGCGNNSRRLGCLLINKFDYQTSAFTIAQGTWNPIRTSALRGIIPSKKIEHVKEV